MTDETTYQYRTSKGEEFWIAFDPERLCVWCELPVGSLSMGGPAICPACDCGNHRDGTKWGSAEYPSLQKRAWKNMDALLPRVINEK